MAPYSVFLCGDTMKRKLILIAAAVLIVLLAIAVISILAAGVVITSTYILMILEPQVDLLDALFEMTSAFSTAGLSTGISSDLHLPAKILSIMIMFTGRLGPLTIASLWYFSRGELALYPDGNIVVG